MTICTQSSRKGWRETLALPPPLHRKNRSQTESSSKHHVQSEEKQSKQGEQRVLSNDETYRRRSRMCPSPRWVKWRPSSLHNSLFNGVMNRFIREIKGNANFYCAIVRCHTFIISFFWVGDVFRSPFVTRLLLCLCSISIFSMFSWIFSKHPWHIIYSMPFVFGLPPPPPSSSTLFSLIASCFLSHILQQFWG